MSTQRKAVIVIILFGLMAIGFWAFKTQWQHKETEVSYTQLYAKVQRGEVAEASIVGTELHGRMKNTPKDEFHTTLPVNYQDLLKALAIAHVTFKIKSSDNNALWLTMIGYLQPTFVIFYLMIAGVVVLGVVIFKSLATKTGSV